eukprot:Platyproteum_vivax@DN1565_c0_g1_i2.p1
MATTLHIVVFNSYLGMMYLISLFLVTLGVVYLARSSWLPYHESAVRQKWDDLDGAMKVLIGVYVNMIGALFLTVGLLLFYVTWSLFAKCDTTAFLVAPGFASVIGFCLLYPPTKLTLVLAPPIRPPLKIGVAVVATSVIATLANVHLPTTNYVCLKL